MSRHITMAGLAALAIAYAEFAHAEAVQIGPRPLYLVDAMEDSDLKERLKRCAAGPFKKSDWSIGHRGAPLQFPEHTVESYFAAARMGAGIVECDVTFTKDRQLVCRHAQNDLHMTTNILETDLAATCIDPFSPASNTGQASAECRTSEITLAQFKSLTGKMDAANRAATTVGEFLKGTADWRTDLYATGATLMTHAESINLFKSLGVKFIPELKAPVVGMPFGGIYTQQLYAQQMINEYKVAGINPDDVYPQSFHLDDILYWIKNEPEFGRQAVYLDNSYEIYGWSPMNKSSWAHQMDELKAMGVNYIGPPIWVLVTLEDGRMVPSLYAREAKAAGLKIISWTAERSGPLTNGGGWYYQSVAAAIENDGDLFRLMHVLHKDVGIAGLFSDWPATTTYYANCFGIGLESD